LTIKIYHNPNCSKSRQTLQLVTEKSDKADVIEYLKTPPSKQELNNILTLLSLTPRELMRRNEKIYSELGLQNESLSDDALLDAMVSHPILIQRPIVVANGKAIIGRPPETLLEIL